jgi:hypothetical protein
MTATIENITMGAHIGANTHHQDHAITPVSLRVPKIKVNALKNPMPPLVLLLLLFFIVQI